jgi:hypothetical protein
MYAYAAQGRICGIVGLRLKHHKEITDKGFALSKKFKTAGAYHFQPVPVPAELTPLYQLYIDKIRPQIVCKRETSSTQEDPLFLNFSGDEFKTLGKYIGIFLREVFLLYYYQMLNSQSLKIK